MINDIREALAARGFELLGNHWEGGLAYVFPARKDRMNVAVKVSKHPFFTTPEVERELTNLDSFKDIVHEGLLPLYGILDPHLRVGSQNYLATWWRLADGTLHDRLKTIQASGAPGISATELVPYFHQLAAALDLLHRGGICHADIKPANLFWFNNRGEPRVCLGDLGLMQCYGQTIPTPETQIPLHTPGYAPPEVVNAGMPWTPEGDLFCLAVSYVELRTGVHLKLYRHRDGAIDIHAVPGMQDAERTVVRRALAIDPADRDDPRRQHAKQGLIGHWVAALDAALTPATTVVHPPLPSPPASGSYPSPNELVGKLARLQPISELHVMMFNHGMPSYLQPAHNLDQQAQALAFVQWARAQGGDVVERIRYELTNPHGPS